MSVFIRADGAISGAVLVCLALLVATAAPVSAQRIPDLGGLGPGDPGRLLPVMPLEQPEPPGHRLVGLGVQPPPPKFVLSLTPSVGSMIDTWMVGASVRFTNTGVFGQLPFALALTDKAVQVSSSWFNRFQADGAIQPNIGDGQLKVGVNGQYLRMAGVTSLEGALEVDVRVAKTQIHEVYVGVIGTYDHAQASTGTSSGPTLGASASWMISGLAEVNVQYSFLSDFNGEDRYLVSLAWWLTGLPGRPQLVMSAGKHNLANTGLGFRF